MSEVHTEKNREIDTLRPIDFAHYRGMCDSEDDFRKTGIQHEEAFTHALEDDRTIVFLHEGRQVPLAAPIDYEKMYNIERCKDLTGKSNILLLAAPLNVVMESEQDEPIAVPEDTAIIVEEFGDISEATVDSTTSRLPFRGAKPHMFINPNLSSIDGHDHAWMSAYSLSFEPANGSSGEKYEPGRLLDDVVAAWESLQTSRGSGIYPEDGTNETYLFTNSQLSSNKELVDELWSIAEVGFGDVLGAHHPLSMEFTRSFFDEQISSNDTLTTVKFVDGEPICFGFLALGMHKNDWLNTESPKLIAEMEDAKQKNRPYVHFHELISKGEKGMGHSIDILSTFLGAAARTGYQYDVFFESTNLSSLYIPKIVDNEIKTSKDVSFLEPIRQLGKLSYWAIVSEDA